MSVINNLLPLKEIRKGIAGRFQKVRLNQNMTQAQLAQRSGVSLESLRRFESKGEISLKNLVRLSIALNRAQDFDELFQINEQIDLFKPEKKQRLRTRPPY